MLRPRSQESDVSHKLRESRGAGIFLRSTERVVAQFAWYQPIIMAFLAAIGKPEQAVGPLVAGIIFSAELAAIRGLRWHQESRMSQLQAQLEAELFNVGVLHTQADTIER